MTRPPSSPRHAPAIVVDSGGAAARAVATDLDACAQALVLAAGASPAQLRAAAALLRGPETARHALAQTLERRSEALEQGVAPHRTLTARESDILTLIGSGLQVKQVAATLAISVSSVNTYRRRIFDKTGMGSNADLIRYAVRRGLVD